MLVKDNKLLQKVYQSSNVSLFASLTTVVFISAFYKSAQLVFLVVNHVRFVFSPEENVKSKHRQLLYQW